MTGNRRWSFISDMNYSGSVTITDLWLWFEWLYFYPGDIIIYLLINKAPAIGNFLEITNNSYGDILSGVISLIIWLMLLSGFWSYFDTDNYIEETTGYNNEETISQANLEEEYVPSPVRGYIYLSIIITIILLLAFLM